MPSAEFKRFWNMRPVSSIFFLMHHHYPKPVSFSVYRDLTARYRKKWSQIPFVQQLLFVFWKIVFLRKLYLVPFLPVLTLITKNLLYWTQPILKVKALSDHVFHSWHGWLQLSYSRVRVTGKCSKYVMPTIMPPIKPVLWLINNSWQWSNGGVYMTKGVIVCFCNACCK